MTNDIVFKRRPDLEHNGCESVWLEVITDRKHILVGTYYQYPVSQGNHCNTVENFIKQIAFDTIVRTNNKS